MVTYKELSIIESSLYQLSNCFSNLKILMNNFIFLLLLQTYFLPVIGLVEPENLTPGDLVVRIAHKSVKN